MKAVRMLGDKRSDVIEVPEPDPKDDLVVVRMAYRRNCCNGPEVTQ